MERHETEKDRENEELIISMWCKAAGFKYEKLFHEGRYKADYAIYNSKERMVALAEVKDRSAIYPTIIMDLSKAKELFDYASLAIPTFFIIRVPTGVFHYRFYDRNAVGIIRTARHHKSNVRETDNGPVVDIPWTDFVPLNDISSRKQSRKESA